MRVKNIITTQDIWLRITRVVKNITCIRAKNIGVRAMHATKSITIEEKILGCVECA